MRRNFGGLVSVSRFEAICDLGRGLLGTPRGAVACAFLIVAAGILAMLPADHDLFARIAIGRLVSEKGIYLSDPFAFTARKSLFVDHEWLAGYLFYQVSQLGGDTALVLFSLLTMGLSMFVLSLATRVYSSRGNLYFLSFVFAVLQCGYIWGSVVRSQVITYVFIPVVLLAIALRERRDDSRLMLFLPVIMIVWVNSHGGFVTGLGLMGLYVLVLLFSKGTSRTALPAISLSAMVAATAANPYGFLPFWKFIFQALAMPRTSISEWSTLWPNEWENLLNYLYFMIIIAGMWHMRARKDWLAIVLFAASLAEAIMHVRFVAIAAMVGCVFCQDYFETVVESMAASFRENALVIRRAGAAAFCGIAMFSACFIVLGLARPLDYSAYPVASVEWLRRSGLHGRLLVDFNNGSYAIWRLFPRFLVSLDGRYEEVYPEETVEIVSRALEPEHPGYVEAFNEVNPDVVLMASGDKVRKALAQLPEIWRVFHADEDYVVLGKGVRPVFDFDPKITDPWTPLSSGNR